MYFRLNWISRNKYFSQKWMQHFQSAKLFHVLLRLYDMIIFRVKQMHVKRFGRFIFNSKSMLFWKVNMEYFMCWFSYPFRQLLFKNFLCWCTNCSNKRAIFWIKREFVTYLASKDFTIQSIIIWRILIMCSAARFNILLQEWIVFCVYMR